MNKINPNDDEIIIEVREIRERLAARYDFDLDRIFEAAMRRQETSPGPFFDPVPKPVEDGQVGRVTRADAKTSGGMPSR